MRLDLSKWGKSQSSPSSSIPQKIKDFHQKNHALSVFMDSAGFLCILCVFVESNPPNRTNTAFFPPHFPVFVVFQKRFLYILFCAYRLHAAERKIDTKVRNIGQQKCYNDLRKGRRSLVWHEQRASRLKNFALVSARKRAAGRNYSGFGFRTVLSARNVGVRNITQFADGTRSSAAPADIRPPSRPGRSCTARTCR